MGWVVITSLDKYKSDDFFEISLTPNWVNKAHLSHQDKYTKNTFVIKLLIFSWPMEKLFEIAPNGARSCFPPTNPDRVNIFRDADFDFVNS